MHFADMVPLVLPGQGTVQAQPPKLWSSMESKSLNGSNVGQQSGDGLDEVLGVSARSLWNSRRCVLESKEFGDVRFHAFHSNKRHSGCLRYLLQAPLNLLHHW